MTKPVQGQLSAAPSITRASRINAATIAQLSPEQKHAWIESLTEKELEYLDYDWFFWSRDQQRAPEGDWNTWVILAGRGFGKGLTLETPIPTPTGWTNIGDLKAGDEVFDEAGKVCRVAQAHEPYQVEEHVFHFSDGAKIGACLDHQWVSWTHAERKAFLRSPYEDTTSFPENWPQWRLKKIVGKGAIVPDERMDPALTDVESGMSMREAERRHGVSRQAIARRLMYGPIQIVPEIRADSPGPRVRTTAEILATLTHGARGDTNHCVPCCGPLTLPAVDLPIDPYTLGYWLGNGTHNQPEVCGHLEDAEDFQQRVECMSVRYDARGSQTFVARCPSLRLAPSLCPDKRLPALYLRASARQRLELLRGFMDSDGYAPKGDVDSVEFCSTKESLAQNVAELAASLGQKPVIGEGRATLNGIDCGPKWRVTWRPTINPFSMPRKANKITSLGGGQSLRNHHRMISSVEPTGRTVWMRCLTVDSPNSMYLAGRAMIPTHNTRAGSEWVRECVCGETPLAPGKYSRVALVAETAADARDVMIEGQSGLLPIHHKDWRPTYEPTKRRLTWPNGATATTYSAEDPDQLRGPQHDCAWSDELAKWRTSREDMQSKETSKSRGETTWDMLQFGLRLGTNPRVLVTTTPRPIPLLRQILKDPKTVVTRGSTYDNAANLAPQFLETVKAKYEGTRLGRQELRAEILEDVPGAMWTIEMIEGALKKVEVPDLARVVVAVDPSGTRGMEDSGDWIGIVCAGKGVDGRYYVLGDWSCKLPPAGWGRRAVDCYHHFGADCIIAERNFGGAMVEAVIRTADPNVPYREVSASRGKIARAEPIAALYEQNRVTHCEPFLEMEAQMMALTHNGYMGDGSPDRLDSCIWGLTELAFGAGTRTLYFGGL